MKKVTLIALLFLAGASSSCGTRVAFPVSSIAPAAEGSVKIKKDKNENFEMEIKVKHLANPERLNPAKKYYVAWLVDSENKVVNLGKLVSDNSNNASLKNVSASKPVQFFVTAEDEGNVTIPSKQELFRTSDLNLN